MKFNDTHISILIKLCAGDYESVSALAREIGLSVSRTDVNLVRLRDMGLVRMERNGKRIRTTLSRRKHARTFRCMADIHPEEWLKRALTGNTAEILIRILRKPLSEKEIADSMDVSGRTVKRGLKPLFELGIVLKKNNLILPNSLHQDLFEFITEALSFANAKKVPKDSIVVWERLDEFISKGSEPVEGNDTPETGYGMLAKYGIPLITSGEIYYFHSRRKKRLKLEDICLHCLVIDRFNARSYIYVTLAMLHNRSKSDREYLLGEAEYLGIRQQVLELRRYIESEGKIETEGFPNWEEIMEKAREYGVHARERI